MKCTFLISFCFICLFISSCDKQSTEPEIEDYQWQFSSPEDQGMDSGVLDSAFVSAASLAFVDAIVVFRNGYIIAEEYYNGHTAHTPHNVKSVSKSFLSAVTGLALEQGYLSSLDVTVLDYFPEYIYPGIDERKYALTIRHLLTMRMGIASESDYNNGVYSGIYHSSNWIKTTLEYPLLSAPGEKMRYNTFQTHLLSAILSKASRMNTLALVRQLLTDPMQITVDGWEKDPQGYYFGGNSMRFTPREMGALGLLYLNNGRLHETQIVPEWWVSFSLSRSTNSGPNEWGAFKNYNYACLWWLGQVNDYDMFVAYGYGGQLVACFPILNLVIVTTAQSEVSPEMSNVQEWALFGIMSRHILPSVIP